MATGIIGIPDTIEVRYERHKSGLICALSDDLPNLMVFGPTIEDVREDIVAAAQDLVLRRFGENVSYSWHEEQVEGFVPLESGLLHRNQLSV